MPKQLNYTLTENEESVIKQAMKASDARMVKRATVIHNLHQGYHPTEVAAIHGISLTSVYNYFNHFKANGIDGLTDHPRSGRPRKATPEYIKCLEATLESDPKEEGYGFTVWTQARLRHHLAQQTGISLSRSRFQVLLHDLGYRYRRPKRDLGHKHDPALRQQVKEALDELKKESQAANSSFSLWMKSPSD